MQIIALRKLRTNTKLWNFCGRYYLFLCSWSHQSRPRFQNFFVPTFYGKTCSKLLENRTSNCIFFFPFVFFSQTLAIYRTAGEGREGTILVPQYRFHMFTNIQTSVCSFVSEMATSFFSIPAKVILRLLLSKIYPHLEISIWWNLNPSRPGPKQRERGKLTSKLAIPHLPSCVFLTKTWY